MNPDTGPRQRPFGLKKREKTLSDQKTQTLEVRLQVLEDKMAVMQVIASYGPLADTAITPDRRRRASALFTEAGVYDLGNGWQGVGREGIEKILDDPSHHKAVSKGAAHVMGIPHIVITGDTATALNYSQIFRCEGDHFVPFRIAANFWEMVRDGNSWKVARRTNRLLNGSDEALDLLRQVDRG
jgi:hypothetical protein